MSDMAIYRQLPSPHKTLGIEEDCVLGKAKSKTLA